MPRKTIKIEDLKAEINRLLSLDIMNEDQRKILCCLLERVLMENGNYQGFTYNDLRTEKCDQWKKENPNVPLYTFIEKYGNEYKRLYT